MKREADDSCPKCGSQCDRDEVDIGVGVQCGPWHCSNCGWSGSRAGGELLNCEHGKPLGGQCEGCDQYAADCEAAFPS